MKTNFLVHIATHVIAKNTTSKNSFTDEENMVFLLTEKAFFSPCGRENSLWLSAFVCAVVSHHVQ